nr:PREDICTED: uncharacterized protein LOC107398885 [Tribolium castaneum]|eukprot:XP_015839925.1 PREDICTED: uncharacterized protein LOC107398885 [Tribolium castaneum]
MKDFQRSTSSRKSKMRQRNYTADLRRFFSNTGKNAKILWKGPIGGTKNWRDFEKVYLAKKTLFYRNRFREYSDHLFAGITRAKQTLKEKVEKRRLKCWLEVAENDLAREPWGVVYKLASEKFKTRGILQSFQTGEDNNITRDFQSTMEFLIMNLLPDDDLTPTPRSNVSLKAIFEQPLRKWGVTL